MSLMDLLNKKSLLPLESEALKGREEGIEIPAEHFVKGTPLKDPFPEGLDQDLGQVVAQAYCGRLTLLCSKNAGIRADLVKESSGALP